jgi:hypothetical protein
MMQGGAWDCSTASHPPHADLNGGLLPLLLAGAAVLGAAHDWLGHQPLLGSVLKLSHRSGAGKGQELASANPLQRQHSWICSCDTSVGQTGAAAAALWHCSCNCTSWLTDRLLRNLMRLPT